MIEWKDRKVVSVIVLDCAKQKRREGGGVCPSPDFFSACLLPSPVHHLHCIRVICRHLRSSRCASFSSIQQYRTSCVRRVSNIASALRLLQKR